MSQLVVFKGDKAGLKIVLAPHVDLAEVFAELAKELAQNSRFFTQGSTASVCTSGRALNPEQLAQLAGMLAERGLVLTRLEQASETKPKANPVQPAVVDKPVPSGAKVVKRTLRSGMRVSHQGDVVVLGDVNPGSEVLATGDIIVFGTLRGVVHAGAAGDLSARVVALRLAPTQLRIGDLIARAPDNPESLPDRPEVARVRDGVVVIEEFAS